MDYKVKIDDTEIRPDVVGTINGIAQSVSVLRLEEISAWVRSNMFMAYKWGYSQGFTNKERSL